MLNDNFVQFSFILKEKYTVIHCIVKGAIGVSPQFFFIINMLTRNYFPK